MTSPDPAERYDTTVDLANDNTSHTQLVRLVGRDRRVLDVGCATGYLAATLRGQGCSVSGIEYEPSAAERARPHLDRLLVGSVDELDLVGELGEACFDVVVYGDVLEHLVDPVATLERTLPLLAPGGAVVASLPHIAHGAVRLALLDGRFDYTETGLLDDTHLRFFTADRVFETFRRAGLEPVALTRTTTGLTGTEIPIEVADYPEAVVKRVLADPESTTYQFVVRAVRNDEADPEQVAALAADERERLHLHSLARRTAAREDRSGLAGAAAVPSSAAGEVGLWGAFDVDDLRQSLLARTTRTELERRLPGVRLRSAAPYGGARTSRVDPGEPLEPLGGGHGREQAELALDAVVVTGVVLTAPDQVADLYGEPAGEDHPALLLARGPGATAAPVLWSAIDLRRAGEQGAADWLAEHPDATVLEGTAGAIVRGSGRSLPDPGLLASSTFDPALLERRLTYLRATGAWPQTGLAVLLQLSARSVDAVDAVAEALSLLARSGTEVTVVLAELDASSGDAVALAPLQAALALPTTVLPVSAGLDDLVAAVAGADAVLATSPTALAVARSFDRLLLAIDLHADPELERWTERVTSLAELRAGVKGLGARLHAGGWVAPLDAATVTGRAALQEHFDGLAARVGRAVVARRAASGEPDAGVGLAERLTALESAHAALRAQTHRERAALAHVDAPVPVPTVDPETEHLRTQLLALQNSRTLRTLRPARSVYARLRGTRL